MERYNQCVSRRVGQTPNQTLTLPYNPNQAQIDDESMWLAQP